SCETLSRVARQLGDDDAAERLAREALTISLSTGNAFWCGGIVAALDALACATADPALCARLLGAVDAHLAAVGHARPVYARDAYERAVTRARTELDEDFDALFTEGATLTVEAAALYAQRGRGRRRRPAIGWDSLTPAEREVVELVAQG